MSSSKYWSRANSPLPLWERGRGEGLQFYKDFKSPLTPPFSKWGTVSPLQGGWKGNFLEKI